MMSMGGKLRFFALVVVLIGCISVLSVAAKDEKECEVCIKVVDDIKGVYNKLVEAKKDKKKLELAENAIEKYCGSKGLSQKDSKMCYSVEPMKKDIARQVSYNKDTVKICQSLSKKNPDFCAMRYPVKTDANTDYSKMRVKQLKKILAERGVSCVGCVEKDDFIKKIKETQHNEL